MNESPAYLVVLLVLVGVDLHLAKLPVALGGALVRPQLPEGLELAVLVPRDAQVLDPSLVLCKDISLTNTLYVNHSFIWVL